MISAASGRNLENLPGSVAGHGHSNTTSPASPQPTAGTADLRADPYRGAHYLSKWIPVKKISYLLIVVLL